MNYSAIRDNHACGTVGKFLQQAVTSDADLSIVSAYFHLKGN